MNDEERADLDEWIDKLKVALGLDELGLVTDDILDLAGDAARKVVRPAAPVTTFLVGYAAGRAAAQGTKPSTAIASAMVTAARVTPEK